MNRHKYIHVKFSFSITPWVGQDDRVRKTEHKSNMHISMLIIFINILVLFVTFVTRFEVIEKQREILM